MTSFKDYTAQDLLTEVDCYGLWWIDEDEGVQDVEANVGQYGEAGGHIYVVMQDGRRIKLTGTNLRAGWDAFAAAHPNAWIVQEVKAGRYDVDAEVAGIMAQQVILGEVVYG